MPESLQNGFQLTELTWHYTKAQGILMTYGLGGPGISLGIALPVLILSTMNVYIGLIATVVIALIITCAIGLLPLTGHYLGVVESINLYMVGGLSVDYVVHLAEAYQSSSSADRRGRVQHMLEAMGISITSGALTTFGAASFMLWAKISPVFEFGKFIMTIISLSYIYSMFGFTTLMAFCGPENDNGGLKKLWQKWCSRLEVGTIPHKVKKVEATHDINPKQTNETNNGSTEEYNIGSEGYQEINIDEAIKESQRENKIR